MRFSEVTTGHKPSLSGAHQSQAMVEEGRKVARCDARGEMYGLM